MRQLQVMVTVQGLTFALISLPEFTSSTLKDSALIEKTCFTSTVCCFSLDSTQVLVAI